MKFLKDLLKSQTGMTLAEMAVAGAVAGIAALGAASLMGTMGGSTRDAEVVIAKTQFSSALGNYLYSGLGCEDLKVASELGNNGYDEKVSAIVLEKWKYEGVSKFQGGVPIGPNKKNPLFTIQGLEASIQKQCPGTKCLDEVTLNGKVLLKTTLKVYATLQIEGRDTVQEYAIPVLADQSNNHSIEFCGDEKTMAETCAALKGTWDPTNSFCKFNETCTAHGAYQTLRCSPMFASGVCPDLSRGTSQPNPVTGNQGCPIGTTAISTGADNWNVTKKCGKKCTTEINHTLGYFTCLKCP